MRPCLFLLRAGTASRIADGLVASRESRELMRIATGLGEQLEKLQNLQAKTSVLASWVASLPTVLYFLQPSPVPWLLQVLELAPGSRARDPVRNNSEKRAAELHQQALCCLGTLLRLGMPADFGACIDALCSLMARQRDAAAHAMYRAAAWVGHELVAQGNATGFFRETAVLLGLLSGYGCAEYTSQQLSLLGANAEEAFSALEGFDVPEFINSFCGLCEGLREVLPLTAADGYGQYSPREALHNAFERVSCLLLATEDPIKSRVASCIACFVEAAPDEFIDTRAGDVSTALRRMTARHRALRTVGFAYARAFLEKGSAENFVMAGGIQAIQRALNLGETERCEELAWTLLAAGQGQAVSTLAGCFGPNFDDALQEWV